MQEYLRTCPFCGCEAKIHKDYDHLLGYGESVGCSKCCIRTQYMPKGKAIEFWNKRAGEE